MFIDNRATLVRTIQLTPDELSKLPYRPQPISTAAAKEITWQIKNSANWEQLQAVYREHEWKLNTIHVSALCTRLAHLALPPSATRARRVQECRQYNSSTPCLKKAESLLRLFVFRCTLRTKD